ncbi:MULTISPECIES: single-stranded DNA-binding protein [Cysteiniphilum]|uniref:single-stranded DNA-binding protein n=1 Tax=Cysteiniphilum TaxID=2056696 RepID=UPI0017821C7C|nr:MULTISPECIES: single-stranded DNA-binding protein [Cysteiniphilum]
MAKGTVNKVIILGFAGGDPEVRYMPSGVAVVNLSIATNDGYKDKQTGQHIDVTEWHNITFFGKQAETIGQYVQKGSKLYVEGRINTQKWQDKNGQDRYTTKVIATEFQLLSSAQTEPQRPSADNTTAQDYLSSTNTGKVNEYAKAKGKTVPTQPPPSYEDFDDDDLPPF